MRSNRHLYTYAPTHTPRICRVVPLILFLLASLFLSSCEFWQQPVRDYFEKWTNEIAIDKFQIEGVESYYDKDGNLCIPSGQDVPVTLFMRNPYHYVLGTSTPDSTLQSQYGYEQESPYITELDPGDNHLITQDADDTTVLHFTYPCNASDDYLKTHDGGGVIGKTIQIRHPYNGNTKDFTFALKCNSKPPRPLNPTVMLTDTSENGEFVLCLNLGNKGLFEAAGIHHDVKSISINEDTYNLSFSGDGTVNISSPSNDKLTNTKDGSWQPNEAGSNINFPHESGKNPIYYLSGINKNTPTTFNIVLSDEAGLTTQISVSSSAQTLSGPSLSSGSTALASGSDINYIECTEGVENGSLTIRAPTTTTKGEILSGSVKTTCTLEKKANTR